MGFLRKNKTPTITKQQASMFFTTIADIGSLVMALIYIAYVGLSMFVGFGVVWLNWTMFGITLAYIAFFLFKIFYLNKVVSKTAKMKRIVKKANKYTKLGMRLINATFVILSMVGVQLGERHVVALIGILVVGITFLVTILIDIGTFFVRRKVQQLMVAWNSLNQEDKAERIELFLSGFVRSINNSALIDDYFDVGMNIKKMVDSKLSDRVRLADARRVDPYGDGHVGRKFNDEDSQE